MSDEVSYEERRRRAQRLRQARKAAGLTQAEAAEAARFPSPRSLQDWEAGRTVPQADQLVAIERALGINYETRRYPDLNAVDPDVYVVLLAFSVFLESLQPAERARVVARLIGAIHESPGENG